MFRSLPVAQQPVKPYNEINFIGREFSSLDIWPQIVQPPQSTAFPAAVQPWKHEKNENIFFQNSKLKQIIS